MSTRAGVDTGGTFTDLVALDEATGEIRITKVLSTPSHPSTAVFDAFAKAGLDTRDISYFVHGMTVATNALIERKGAEVALLTTDGFRDILRIQRVTRPRHFDLHWVKPKHFVPRSRCIGVPERVLRDGSVLVPLDEERLREEIVRLRHSNGVSAVAVSYLFSFVHPEHELRTRELLEELWPGVQVSLSHEVLPRWREYERTSTTVLDAYLKPLMHDYMQQLEDECEAGGIGQLLILRSNGGVMTSQKAREQPVALVRSGPSGGIMASSHVGKRLGLGDLIACDMGGTSFEACLLPGSEPTFTNLEELEDGVPIALTMVDARAIGAGGGSLAWVDAAGILKVGPESAGADPGPACYGRGGTQATVTDANAVLGRLAPEFLLAGDLELDVEAAARVLDALAGRLGLSRERVAQGIVDVANHNMAQALRLVSTDRGYDPRGSTLVAYGGAGPLHACELARALQIRQVLVPYYPGAFSAFGALLADTRFDYTQTAWMQLRFLDLGRANELFEALERRALDDFRREGFAEAPRLVRSTDMRYVGQNWELSVAMPGGTLGSEDFERAATLFEREHERFYGYSIPGEEIELLTFNVAAVGARHTVELPRIEPGPAPAPIDRRGVVFRADDGPVETAVYRRETFPAGCQVQGPALIGQIDATTLLLPGSSARVDEYGNLLITA
ncbi:MAG: hydantoinase/oxoprolinase family protein [Thermoleophilia bacterium]|nr:hydantoinase/oxoprolinase family protein [Thermoleophilia bacterium]